MTVFEDLINELRMAREELDKLQGYDRSKSLEDNIKDMDERFKLEQENKLLKKNIKRIKEGKAPKVHKDLAWFQAENARLKAELAAKLAKKQRP